MLTQVDVDSENAFLIPIQGATPKDSLLIREITGLGPPDINLFIGDYARDGGSYQGRRVGSRNVVIRFDLNPNPALGQTVSGLRQILYKAFIDPLVDGDYVKLTLYDDDGRVMYLYGYTEKFDNELFQTDTSVQISMLCPDPYLRDNVKTVMTNPSGWTSVPFAYAGTAETGFEARIVITASTPTLTIENNGKTMVLSRAFSAGEVVYVNTNPGSRSVTVTTTDGITSSILPYLDSLSPWIQLHSQANTLKVYGQSTANLPAAIQSFIYEQTYWGV